MKKLLLLLPLLLTSCSVERYSPLQYCLWEIQSNEGYEQFSYFYHDFSSQYWDEADKGCKIYSYYITTLTDEVKGEWFCFIECKHKHTFNNAAGSSAYAPDEVILIDCDLAFETYYTGE